MVSNEPLDLQQQLAQITAEFLRQASPVDVAELEQANEVLKKSGILDSVLKNGDRAPDFTLPNAIGRPYRLADGLARGPVVVSFYRGIWCPYCNLQLRAYQQILPQIHALGATLVAISPQSPDHSQATLLNNFLQYEVLSDLGNKTGRAFGLVYPLGETVRRIYRASGVDLSHYNADESWEIPLPGTFVINSDGCIRLAFVDTDVAKRLDPAVLLAVLTRLAAERK